MSNAFTLDEKDIPPSILTAVDTEPGRCQHPGCTNSVTKPARGRTPKLCDEHKSAASSGTGNRKPTWARAGEIEVILTTYVTGLGKGLMLLNEVDGSVIASGGPAVVHELVELAKTDKGIRKYLEWVATPGKYAPLTLAVFAVVFPILGNHGMLPKIFVTIPSEEGKK